MAGGDAKYVLNPEPLTVDDALNVVNAPVDAVVAPTDVLFIVPPVIAAEVFSTLSVFRFVKLASTSA
jgi:hypothetical protein